MANGYVPGSSGPPIERKSYSQLINEQVARISQNAQANMLRRSQQRELETQRLLDRQNALTGMQITGVSPEDALALGSFKNQINQNMDGGYTNVSQLNADINTFTTDLLAAQAKYSMGTKGAESYTSKSGKTDLNGAAYVTSEEDLDTLSNYWNSGMFQSVDGAPALTVSGDPGSLRLTGIPLDQNGNVIEGGPVSIGSHPLMMNAERLFEPPTMDPPTTDDVVRDLVLGGKMEGLFKGIDGETAQISLYGELGETAFDQNNLLLRYRQQWLRDNPEKADRIPRDPKEWTDEVWKIVDPEMTREALLERFRKTAKEARDSAGIESDSRLSSATAVGPDGKPGFEKPMELFTGVTTAAGESLDGELLRVRIIGEGQTTDGENPETVYDYELYYKDENGVLRTVRVPVGDPAHSTASSIFNNLPISDKATIMRQAGIDPNAEKKNPAVTDEDAEDPPVDAEDPAATTTTTTATGGGPSTKSVTATNQAAEEQTTVTEEEEDQQAALKSEYDELLRDARSAKVADFFNVGKPYSEFVRSIQNLPLSMQKRLIQDKLNEEASNYKRGSRPEVLKTMIDKLNEMGVEAVTDEDVRDTYDSLEVELAKINYELSTMNPQSQAVQPSMAVAGLNPVFTNDNLASSPEYTQLLNRREEIKSQMQQYENVFGVMTPQPTAVEPVATPSVKPIEGAPVVPPVIQAPATTNVAQGVVNELYDGGALPEVTINAPREEVVETATNIALELLNVDERDNVEAIRTFMDVAVGPEVADSLFRTHREGNIAALKEEGKITDDMTEEQVQDVLDKAIEEYRGYTGSGTDYDPTPHWCAAFVTYMIRNSVEGLDPNSKEYKEVVSLLEEFDSSFEGSDYAEIRAKTFLNVGESIDFKKTQKDPETEEEIVTFTLENAKKGDIIVIRRGTAGHHVGFFYGTEIDPSTGEEMILVFGGNQNDAVNVTPYSKKKLLGVQRVHASLLPLEEIELISKTMSLVDDTATASAN